MNRPASFFAARWPRARVSVATRCLVVAGLLAAVALVIMVVVMFLQHPKQNMPMSAAMGVPLALIVIAMGAFWFERGDLTTDLVNALSSAGWNAGNRFVTIMDKAARDELEGYLPIGVNPWDGCGGAGIVNGRRVYVWMHIIALGKKRHTRIRVMCETHSRLRPFSLATPTPFGWRILRSNADARPPVDGHSCRMSGNWFASHRDAESVKSRLTTQSIEFLRWSPASTGIASAGAYLLVDRLLWSNRDAEPDRVQEFIAHAALAAELFEQDLSAATPADA